MGWSLYFNDGGGQNHFRTDKVGVLYLFYLTEIMPILQNCLLLIIYFQLFNCSKINHMMTKTEQLRDKTGDSVPFIDTQHHNAEGRLCQHSRLCSIGCLKLGVPWKLRFKSLYLDTDLSLLIFLC